MDSIVIDAFNEYLEIKNPLKQAKSLAITSGAVGAATFFVSLAGYVRSLSPIMATLSAGSIAWNVALIALIGVAYRKARPYTTVTSNIADQVRHRISPEEIKKAATDELKKFDDILKRPGERVKLFPLMQDLYQYVMGTVLPPDPARSTEMIHGLRAAGTTLSAFKLPDHMHALINANPHYRHDINRMVGRIEDQLGFSVGTLTAGKYFTNAPFDFKKDYIQELCVFDSRANDLEEYKKLFTSLKNNIERERLEWKKIDRASKKSAEMMTKKFLTAELEKIGSHKLSPPLIHKILIEWDAAKDDSIENRLTRVGHYCDRMIHYCDQRPAILKTVAQNMRHCEDIFKTLDRLQKGDKKNSAAAKYLLAQLRESIYKEDKDKRQSIRVTTYMLAQLGKKEVPDLQLYTKIKKTDAENLVEGLKEIISTYSSTSHDQVLQGRRNQEKKKIETAITQFAACTPHNFESLIKLIRELKKEKTTAKAGYSFFTYNKRLSAEYLEPMIQMAEGFKHYLLVKDYANKQFQVTIDSLRKEISTYTPSSHFFEKGRNGATSRLMIKKVILDRIKYIENEQDPSKRMEDINDLSVLLLKMKQSSINSYGADLRTPLTNKIEKMLERCVQYTKLHDMPDQPQPSPRQRNGGHILAKQ